MAAASLPVVCCGSQQGAFNTPVDQRLGLVSYLTHAHAHTHAVPNSCLVPAACFAAPTTRSALLIQQMSPRFTMLSYVKSCLSGTITSKINYYRCNNKAQRRNLARPQLYCRECVFYLVLLVHGPSASAKFFFLYSWWNPVIHYIPVLFVKKKKENMKKGHVVKSGSQL